MNNSSLPSSQELHAPHTEPPASSHHSTDSREKTNTEKFISFWQTKAEAFVNMGVHDELPIYQKQRVRFSNFIEFLCQGFYFFYAIVGICLHSKFLTIITTTMLVSGSLGFWFNYKRDYNTARFMFITVFSILLFILCNSMNVGPFFILFYFPSFIVYTLYYDLQLELTRALINLTVSAICAALAFILPPYLFFSQDLGVEWIPFMRDLNYFLSFGVTITFVFCSVFYVRKTGQQLVFVWQEAERQKLELARAKQKAEIAEIAKSRFLSNMSHEMRTPLYGIVGTVNLMIQEHSLPEQQENLKVLKYSSEHMLNVVNDVLDFGKIEAKKMELASEIFNMKDLLNELYTIFQNQFKEKALDFAFDVDAGLDKHFRGDETRLRQVLANLLGNALKFTNQGQVTCKATLETCSEHLAAISFEVTDTGIGMTMPQQQSIFEAFAQGDISTSRRFGGTGLGLTISKKLVSMMGGNLLVDSNLTKGSRFYFTIRLNLETQKVKKEIVHTKLRSLKGTRVLIAEDSVINMTITRKFLQRWDITIDEAVNGMEAVDLFNRNRYDLLLIDLDMPVMNGYEALLEIRKKNLQVPVIAFTAAIIPNMKEKLRKSGFDDLIQKPFRPEELHKLIASYCVENSNVTIS